MAALNWADDDSTQVKAENPAWSTFIRKQVNVFAEAFNVEGNVRSFLRGVWISCPGALAGGSDLLQTSKYVTTL